MKVYESKGTFDCKAQTFNLKVQTTDINPDAFYISAFYNVINWDEVSKRYAAAK